MKEKFARSKYFRFLLILLLGVGLVYAALEASIYIMGTGLVKGVSWNIYIESVSVDENSVSSNVKPVVEEGSVDTISLNYEVSLSNPGDYYSFDVVVKNAGSINAMLSTNPVLMGLSDNFQNYIVHTVTTTRGKPVEKYNMIEAGKSKTYRVKVMYRNNLEVADLPETGDSFSLNLSFNFEAANKKTYDNGAEQLIVKANNSTALYDESTKKEMFAFNHEATSQLSLSKDYRFIGDAPNNYIDYNNETWRIIGVFPVDNGLGNIENRIKIIKNSLSIMNKAWNSSDTNEWVNGSLDTYLNSNNEGGYYYSLTEEAKNQISDAIYYLGGYNFYEESGDTYYAFERGLERYSSDRSENIKTKIGLMYPSDYIFTFEKGVNSSCFSNAFSCSSNPNASWLYSGGIEWTITPVSGIPNRSFNINSAGSVNFNYYNTNNMQSYRPVVYLASSVELSGTGTQSDHYKIY